MRKRKKTDLNFTAFENITEKQVYLIGDAGFILGHIIYLIMFAFLGVNFMVGYNCFSILFYIVLYFLLSKANNRNDFIFVALIEVIVHSCLGVYFMGWGMGFAMYMLFIMPIPFFMPLKKFYIPYIFSLFNIAVFVLLKLYMTGNSGIYTFTSPFINNMVYLTNMAFGFIIIIYISSIYMFHREMLQLRLTAKNESLQKLASVDPLTQLFNRRAMMDFLRMIQSNAAHTKTSYVIALGDIDDFKHINDTYGHDTGDEVLKRASEIMAKIVPAEGYVCRWGGEEFLFAVPNADGEEGKLIANHICSRLGEEEFKCGSETFKVTITMGVSEVAYDENFEKSILAADRRLYIGKQNGKNRVVCSDEE